MEGHWSKQIFAHSPQQWGLRGDPYLWEEMKASLVAVDLPADSREFNRLLADQFEKLVGLPLSHSGDVYVERYAFGGMSSGHVCVRFWREEVIPMLCKRFEEL